jgi:hypothetical protein
MKDIIIFGASKLGQVAMDYFKNNYGIIAFADNDKGKVGNKFNELPIIDAKTAIKISNNNNIDIIIASMYSREIEKQLLDGNLNRTKLKIFKVNVDKSNLQREAIKIQPEIFKNYTLHIMVDNIYCNQFIELVNKHCTKHLHIFFIVADEFKYVKTGYQNCHQISWQDEVDRKLLFTYLIGCQKLMIHYLTDCICNFIVDNHIDLTQKKVGWAPWGGDFYEEIPKELYQSITKQMLQEHQLLQYKDTKPISVNKRYVVENIDYIHTGLIGEYNLIKKGYNIQAQFVEFAYPLNLSVNYIDKVKYNRTNVIKSKLGVEYLILLGNSATPTNNHLEVLNMLAAYKNKKIGIVIPLNYGMLKYREIIEDSVKQLFGTRVMIIKDFLDIIEYVKIINQCDCIIMNHERQQAFGNILIGLYLGKKIYINSRSTLYDLLKDKRLKIFDTNSISIQHEGEWTLDIEQAKDNINIIKKEYSGGKFTSTFKQAITYLE